MPASLQQPTSLGGQDIMASNAGSTAVNAATALDSFQENRTVKLALELAMLQGGLAAADHHHHNGPTTGYSGSSSGNNGGGSDQVHHNMLSGSLEDLKTRRSQNMTECVPVPSSEHVAEIVGRQGCKIKALRAKTNTYIKTPVRGEEPVFVVTGRKEDVGLAKREILSAADHFSQIRATRKNNINSTLAFGQLMANTPGQATEHVRVPYRVVGLVVGPKGATIKRIQQQTHTYIVTPSRDKEPVFEVTGLPENVEAAKKEIEAHIALRTGNGTYFADGSDFIDDNFGTPSAFNSSAPHLDQGKFNSILSSGRQDSSSFDGPFSKGLSRNLTLQHLLDSSNNLDRALGPWSNGTDSHDSGIGHSPPFDSTLASTGPILESSSGSLNGIWGELNKALGNLDLDHSTTTNHLFGTRSSLDLGSLGSLGPAGGPMGGTRPSIDLGTLNSTANNTFSNNSSSSSPPTSLPFGGVQGGGASPIGSEKTSPFEAALASVSGSDEVIHEKIAFSSVSDKPLSAAGDFISFANK